MSVFESAFVVFVLVHVFVYVCTCVYVFVYVIVYTSFLYHTCVNVYVNHEYILAFVSLCMCILSQSSRLCASEGELTGAPVPKRRRCWACALGSCLN